MVVVSNEKHTLPQTQYGIFIANKYEEDMKLRGMYVQRDESTLAISLSGSLVFSIPDETIEEMIKLKERQDGRLQQIDI